MPYNPNTIWLSHTSLGDYEKCHRLYYLRNLYRDSRYGNKFRVQVASPYLSLGQAVHDAIDNFVKRYNADERTKENLTREYNKAWEPRNGKRGGFKDSDHEKYFKDRGELMLERFYKNEPFRTGNTIRIDFPKLSLMGVDDIVLVGNFDWLEENESGLHILDFKTGTSEEEGSLQLPIYALLAEENLKKKVSKVSYWYLDRDDEPKEVDLVELEPVLSGLKSKAQEVLKTIQTKDFVCQDEACIKDCLAYQAVERGEAEHLFTDYARKREVFYPIS